MTTDFPSYDEGRGKDRLATREKVDQTENALLHPVDKDGKPTAVWVDQDKGFIQIPIDEAMIHEVADLKNVTVGEGAAIPGTAAAAPAKPTSAPSAATPPASTTAAPAAPNATQGKPAAPAQPKPKKKKPVSEPTGPTPPTHA
jgi:hypothetical protein